MYWPITDRLPITRTSYEHEADGQLIAVDFACPYWTYLLAVADSEVTYSGEMGVCGIAIQLEWDDDSGHWLARYCHLVDTNVKVGDCVVPGQVVGYAGDTGWATGPHLHLLLELNGNRVRPEEYLSAD